MSSMMTIVFGLFVAVVYLVLYVIDKRVKDDGKAVKASNIILLVASLFFIVYSDCDNPLCHGVCHMLGGKECKVY